MFKLLKTNLRHLTFRRIFLLAAAAMLLLGIDAGLSMRRNNFFTSEDFIFGVPIVAGVAIFIIAREHSDGTLRTKLTIGYTRPQIFFSFIISSFICMIVLFLCLILPFFMIGGISFSEIMPAGKIAFVFFVIFMVYAAACIGSAAIALCFSRLVVIIAVTVLAALTMAGVGGSAARRLSYPATFMEHEYDARLDEYIASREVPNREYVTGFNRDILRTVYKASLFTQMRGVDDYVSVFLYRGADVPREQYVEICMNDTSLDDSDSTILAIRSIYQFPLFALGWIAVSLAAGIIVFRKRNIN